MKHHAVVLIIIRFFAVAVALYCLYVIGSVALSDLFGPDLANAAEAKMIEYGKQQAVVGALRGVGAGIVIYFVAPFLARLIIWRSES